MTSGALIEIISEAVVSLYAKILRTGVQLPSPPPFMSIQPINNIAPSSYQLAPLFETMLQNTDKLPDNTLPLNTEGSVISEASLLPPVTLYNSHGLLVKSDANSLIAYA